MKIPIFGWLAIFLGATATVRADALHDLLGKLQEEISKTMAQHSGDKKSHYEMERLTRDLETLNKDFARETFNAVEAARVLKGLATAKISAEGKELAQQLVALLPDEAEVQRKDYAARLEALLKQAADACLAAKKDTDLDTTLADLNALKQPGYSSAPDYNRNSGRREGAVRTVRRWQEYLAHLASGYDDRAKSLLHEMAETPGSFPLLTREQILSKLGDEPKPESAEKVIAAVKNLDELPKAIEQIGDVNRKRRSTDIGAYETTAALNDLKQIYKAHAAGKAGLFQNALQVATSIYDAGSGVAPVEILRLKTMLLAEILPAWLELPAGEKPRAGESPGQFLLRLADESVTKSEWEKVRRLLDAYRASAFGVRAPSWLQGEITACSSYLAAQKLENAGDFRRAISEYEKVLLQAGKRAPVKEATARIAALKREQPAAFEAASRANANGEDSSDPAGKKP